MSDCDNMVLACRKLDHFASGTVNLCYVEAMKTKLNPFDLNRKEYAELLGITPNAVRMRQRQKKLEGEYIFENGKYLFRAPQRVRDFLVNTNGQETTKKTYNRGNHFKADYPNDAFRRHNELKMLAKLKHSVDDETQELLPEAVRIAKEKKVARRMRALSASEDRNQFRDYGTGLYNMSNKGYGTEGYYSGSGQSFKSTNRGRTINKKGAYEI